MSKRPQDRYPTCREFAEALAPHAAPPPEVLPEALAAHAAPPPPETVLTPWAVAHQEALHEPLTNALGMKFAWIPPDTFLMGSPEGEKGRDDNETQHRVTLTKGFHLGIHQVTRGQFARFVKADGYQTEAERDGGAYGWTGKEWKLDPDKN